MVGGLFWGQLTWSRLKTRDCNPLKQGFEVSL